MDPPHFLPRLKPCRRQADKSNRRFRKTLCLLGGEKRAATGGDGSVGGPDEIKRRDSTIVEAKSLAGAKRLTKGHPFLSQGKGKFSIELFELIPM